MQSMYSNINTFKLKCQNRSFNSLPKINKWYKNDSLFLTYLTKINYIIHETLSATKPNIDNEQHTLNKKIFKHYLHDYQHWNKTLTIIDQLSIVATSWNAEFSSPFRNVNFNLIFLFVNCKFIKYTFIYQSCFKIKKVYTQYNFYLYVNINIPYDIT